MSQSHLKKDGGNLMMRIGMLAIMIASADAQSGATITCPSMGTAAAGAASQLRVEDGGSSAWWIALAVSSVSGSWGSAAVNEPSIALTKGWAGGRADGAASGSSAVAVCGVVCVTFTSVGAASGGCNVTVDVPLRYVCGAGDRVLVGCSGAPAGGVPAAAPPVPSQPVAVSPTGPPPSAPNVGGGPGGAPVGVPVGVPVATVPAGSVCGGATVRVDDAGSTMWWMTFRVSGADGGYGSGSVGAAGAAAGAAVALQKGWAGGRPDGGLSGAPAVSVCGVACVSITAVGGVPTCGVRVEVRLPMSCSGAERELRGCDGGAAPQSAPVGAPVGVPMVAPTGPPPVAQPAPLPIGGPPVGVGVPSGAPAGPVPASLPVSVPTAPASGPQSVPTAGPSGPPPATAPSVSSGGWSARVAAAIEGRDAFFNMNVLLKQNPDLSWTPSSLYRWGDFLAGLTKARSAQGVGGMRWWVGDAADDVDATREALTNIALFIAQSMKESIQYDACDENNWDSTSGYAVTNACGQLGQNYSAYDCDLACPSLRGARFTAATHAQWYGAPGPLFCAPDEDVARAGIHDGATAGRWDHTHDCWPYPATAANFSDPSGDVLSRSECQVYKGQKGGKFVKGGGGGRSVDGCCWWGRGVIQTTGRCNFGTLNHFLGRTHVAAGSAVAALHDVRRDGVAYPDVDFCADPGVICRRGSPYPELKWIAGMFYWMRSVERYSSEGWNYIDKVREYVRGGLAGEWLVDAVSGIVNRGCHTGVCSSGPVDGLGERRANFHKVMRAFGLEA